jgi:pilus assembly protein CpaF
MTSELEIHAMGVLRTALAPVLPWIDDERVSEIMINRSDSVWIEREGRMDRVPVRMSESCLRAAIRVIGMLSAREARDRGAHAVIEARVAGMRVAAAFPPVSIEGTSMCVRKHVHRLARLDDYGATAPPRQASYRERSIWRAIATPGSSLDLLRDAVRARRNILVSGATSSGKTTFLNALLAAVPPAERVVTIEDTSELCVPVPNFVAFESDPAAGIGLRELLRIALRYRPDRIVVGEVRGAEAFDLLQALSTGHRGGFATIHASSATGALARLEQLVLASGVPWPAEAIRHHVGATIDLLVHLERTGEDRGIAEVVAVCGGDAHGYRTRSLYRPACPPAVFAGEVRP